MATEVTVTDAELVRKTTLEVELTLRAAKELHEHVNSLPRPCTQEQGREALIRARAALVRLNMSLGRLANELQGCAGVDDILVRQADAIFASFAKWFTEAGRTAVIARTPRGFAVRLDTARTLQGNSLVDALAQAAMVAGFDDVK